MDAEPFDAVLFDLDGVLLDSERPGLELLAERLQAAGVAFEGAELQAVCGRPRDYLHGFVTDRLGPLGLDPDAFVVDYDARKNELIARGEIRPFPGALGLLTALRRAGLRLALATSTERPRAEVRLAGTGLLEAFDATVTGDEVVRGKPAPDIFLLAAERVGTNPDACWVIEDSQAGVTAARAAGMRVIAVAGTFERAALSDADHVVDDLVGVGARLGVELAASS
jgi:HAD superfamily hydrolase (TIGR01509 family)